MEFLDEGCQIILYFLIEAKYNSVNVDVQRTNRAKKQTQISVNKCEFLHSVHSDTDIHANLLIRRKALIIDSIKNCEPMLLNSGNPVSSEESLGGETRDTD